MKKITKTFILTLAHLLICASLMAQAPQKMSYQAVIRDASQVLVVNQSVGIQISILQGSAFGTAVYVETQQPTSNMNGLVNIEIGNGNVILGNFSTIDWANGSYFIKTETDPTGGTNYTITGTNQLLSVPYALYAENAGSSIPGPQGPAGADGTNGIDGINGVDGVDGINGTNGVDGTNGMDGINGVDGTNGVDGISIKWLGSLATAPSSPSLNDGYYNTTLLQSFIWDGIVWQVIAKDGTTGLAGADGALNAWSLNGNAGTNSSTNFMGTTDNKDVVFKRGGLQAGLLNISLYNTSWGVGALNSATTGSNNTANGVNALYSNTTGARNTAYGMNALYSNTTGNENTANGYNALYSNTIGVDNTAIGWYTLYSNITGSRNTGNGFQALHYNEGGVDNTAIGYNSLYSNTNGGWNTAIGVKALYNNTVGAQNTAIGESSLFNNTTGIYNVAIGNGALSSVTTGNNNIAIGYGVSVPFGTADNQVKIGNVNITYAGVQVAWSITSDKRWKTNIMPSNLGLDFIKKLNPVFYTRTNDKNNKTEYGFIAQELEATLNNSGAKNNGIITIDDEGMYSVRYNDLIAPMVKAMQEQQQIIEQQQVLIEKMQKKIDNLIK